MCKALNFSEIGVDNDKTLKTGNDKFDSWFSRRGGVVLGTVIFVTGTSGAGKTTLMINLMEWFKDVKSYFYSREMSKKAVKDQIGDNFVTNPEAFFMDENEAENFELFMKEVEEAKPTVLIIDSLQAIAMADYPGMNRDEACDMIRIRLTKWAQDNNSVCFIIGHNTKENDFAGKNTIMQMVDAHMVLEYDKKTNTRQISWGNKNRKGPMGSMYYEINDGSIEFFTNEEYAAKLNKLNNLSFIDVIASHIEYFIKGIDKNNENYDSFLKELKIAKSQSLKRNKEKNVFYYSELLVLTNQLIEKYEL